MIAKIEQLLKEVEALHASNAEELEASAPNPYTVSVGNETKFPRLISAAA